MGTTIISTRRHLYFGKRATQLQRNRLAVLGGRDYIDARLWRAPNETDAQWLGDADDGIVGRRERTALVNDAQRIASKIQQYIFKKPIDRKGADETFLANVSGEQGVTEFMKGVCNAITTQGWCWLQADRAPYALDETGAAVPRTLADRAPVRWRLWEAVDVPDWCMDSSGVLRWLVTRSVAYLNDDPHAEAKEVNISTLYRLVDGRVYVTEEADREGTGLDLRTDAEIAGLDRLPFILVGRPSPDAWWFDDVEMLQAQALNLDSNHFETLTETLYPQLVAPMSLLNTLDVNLSLEKMSGKEIIALQRELIKGRKNPFYENAEDKGVTRYLMPPSDGVKLLPDECARKRNLLFDMAGLALFNRETRQVQTAEAKAFDQMDTNATLGNRALMLQDAEKKLVALSRYFDPSFKEYEPVYPAKFDVVDAAAMSQAVQIVVNLPQATLGMRKICLRSGLKLLQDMGAVEEADYEEAMREIDALKPAEASSFQSPRFGAEDEDDDDEGDE